MTSLNRLEHQFVEAVPSKLEVGILYVSLEYTTMIHLCCCGCGNEVITPLSPNDWKMTFDGKSISVHPSVGSWSLPCRSHYVIKHGRVNWAADWTEEQIARGRDRDQLRKAIQPEPENPPKVAQARQGEPVSILTTFRTWLGF